jgi:hypothetical protein
MLHKNSEIINVKQYVTNKKGNKVAAILEIKELDRLRELLEDLSDLKTIELRAGEKTIDYETYSRKRKSSLHV